MKLTKSQLKRIIKEELGKALKETPDSQKDIAGLAAASPLGTSPGTWTTATDVAPKLPKWSTEVVNPEVFKMALEHVHKLVAEVNKITKNDFVKVYDGLDGTDMGTGPFCKKRTVTKEATAGGPIYGDPEEHDLGDKADDIVGRPINRPDPDFTSAGELSSGFRGMFRGRTFAEWVDIGESNRPNPGKTVAKCIYKKIVFAPITSHLGLSIEGGTKGFVAAMEAAQELYRKVEKEGSNSISYEEREKLYELHTAIQYLRVTMHGAMWGSGGNGNLMRMSYDMDEDMPRLLKALGYHRRDRPSLIWPPKQIKESKMKLTKTQLKRIIKEELEALSSSGGALLREEEPERPWVMPKGSEEEPYTSNIVEVYAFLDESYEKNKSKKGYPTLMGYELEHFVKENLGPNWVRWMVANYFNDKLGRERTPEEVSKTYTEYIMKM